MKCKPDIAFLRSKGLVKAAEGMMNWRSIAMQVGRKLAKQLVLLSIVLLLCGVQELLASESIRECPLTVMKKANDAAKSWWWSGPPDWGPTVYHIGNLALYNWLDPKDVAKATYLQRSRKWAEGNIWDITDSLTVRYADHVACGQVYVELFNAGVPSADLGPIIEAVAPSVWKDGDWWWIDAIFMAGPLLSKLGEYWGEREGEDAGRPYFDRAYTLYQYTKDDAGDRQNGGIGLYDATEHLWYDVASKVFPKTKTPGNFKEFWARGNGWVIAALPGMIESLENFISQYPSSSEDLKEHRNEYIKMLQDMAARLIQKQRKRLINNPVCTNYDPSLQEQDADGFWNVSLYDCQHFPGPETTGTALFTSAIAWGIRHGHLNAATYAPVVANAWNDMVQVGIYKWRHQDIGAVRKPGNYTYDKASDLYKITGGGADIWGTADAFHNVFQPLSGDGEIIARVESIANTSLWAKAGVMIRETLNANAPNVLLALTPDRVATFQRRKAFGSTSISTKHTGVNIPYWVKLVRKGDQFTGYRSVDGKVWQQVGSDTISMAKSVYIGLAVTAHTNITVTVAELSGVRLQGQPVVQDLGYVQWAADEPADRVCAPKPEYQVNGKCSPRPADDLFRDDEWLKNATNTNPIGVGTFLMAGSEIYQLALERPDLITLPPGCK